MEPNTDCLPVTGNFAPTSYLLEIDAQIDNALSHFFMQVLTSHYQKKQFHALSLFNLINNFQNLLTKFYKFILQVKNLSISHFVDFKRTANRIKTI